MPYKDNLNDIIEYLESGQVILTPTDTVWSLSCDAHQEKAIHDIYQIKKRPDDKNITVLVSDLEMLNSYVPNIHPRIQTLHTYLTRPLTLLYENVLGLPSYLYDNEMKVAFRIIQSGFCHELIEAFGRAITCTSANVESEPYPSNFGAISSEIIRKVGYIARTDQHPDNVSEPSVVATFDQNGELIILRP
jgi:L-threonylcarbamoyladenylate synthase